MQQQKHHILQDGSYKISTYILYVDQTIRSFQKLLTSITANEHLNIMFNMTGAFTAKTEDIVSQNCPNAMQ